MTDARIPMGEGREQQARAVLAIEMEKQRDASPTANEWAFILRHVPNLSENGAVIAAIRAMLAFADTPPPAAAGDRLREKIAEVMAEDGGCWHACSGCQESVDGYVSYTDYPYSEIFKCQPGAGCSECGGIGVLWDDGAFLAGYANAALRTPEPNSGGEVDHG